MITRLMVLATLLFMYHPSFIMAPGVLFDRVESQPYSQPGYVTTSPDAVSRFSMAEPSVVGLLAHNFLAGSQFAKLKIGDKIYLFWTGGRMDIYQVTAITRYRMRGDRYIDLRDGLELTTQDVFNRHYRGASRITLQTCTQDGRLFITALPWNIAP